MVKLSIGGLTFLAGLLIILVSAFVNIALIPLLLVFVGLAVALLNVSKKESTHAMLQYVVLAIIGLGATWASLGATLATIPQFGTFVQTWVTNLAWLINSTVLFSVISMFVRTHKD